MATTDVSLCSRALVLLGAQTIGALTDETDRARVCANAYPGLRAALLSRHAWRFLMTKKQLTRDTEAPIGEWKYSYVVPGEALTGAPHAVFFDANGRVGQAGHEVFGRRVYSNSEALFIDFTEQKSEAEWPPYFQQLVVYALMAEIAFAITDQQNTADFWHVKAFGLPSEAGQGGAFGEAVTIDSQGNVTPAVQSNDFINARAGGFGHFGYDFSWPGEA